MDEIIGEKKIIIITIHRGIYVILVGKWLKGGKDGLEGNFELIQMHNAYAHVEHGIMLW
jgi:hypothetical protein